VTGAPIIFTSEVHRVAILVLVVSNFEKYQEADICNAYSNTLSSDVGSVTWHNSDTSICN